MTTVNVPDEIIQKAMQVAHGRTPQDIVIKALEEFVTHHDQRSLIPLLGTLDDFMTPEELDEMRRAE